MNIRQYTSLIVFTLILFIPFYASCAQTEQSSIKAIVLTDEDAITGKRELAFGSWTANFTKKISLSVAQEDRLIDTINKLIRLADKIDDGSLKHKVEEIEFNVAVDAEGDAVLVTIGSSSGIIVRLRKK